MESGPPLNLTTTVKVEDLPAMAAEDEPRDFTVEGEVVEESPDESKENCDVDDPPLPDEMEEDLEPDENAKESSESTNQVLSKKDHAYGADKSYQCSECGQCFSRASQLRSHERTHFESQTYECDQCDKVFSRVALLMSHRREHHRQTFACSECDAKFPHYNSFRLHMRRHKGERPFKCGDCNMAFVQVCHLHIHRRIHTGEKPFQCDVCNQRFKQVSHLTTHLRIHTKDKPYSCDTCGASFSQTSSLTRHKRRHSGEKPFKCEICSAPFVERRNLTRHMLTHTGEKPFQCDVCDARFAQMIDCKRHKMSHEGIKPYKCNVCEAAFSRKNNLRWHKLTHEGETPYKCEKCNAGFSLMRDLKTHMRTHAGIKPYSCDQCGATFAQHGTLKRHRVIHSGERQFSCTQCQSSFKEKSALKRHLMRHEGVKPFACGKCDSTFIEFRNLKRHKVVVHGEERFEGADVVLDQPIIENQDVQVPKKRPDVKNDADPLGEIYDTNFQTAPAVQTKQEALAPPHTPHVDITENNLTLSNPLPQTQPPQQADVNATVSSQQQLPEILTIPAHAPGQMPTLLLTQPGQPPKPARPANACQNHQSHVITFVEGNYNQWQSWCFCDTPNIPESSQNMIDASGAVVNQPQMSVAPVPPSQPQISYTELQQPQQQQTVGVPEVNQADYQVSHYDGGFSSTMHHYEDASQNDTLATSSHHQQLSQHNSTKMNSMEEQRLFPITGLDHYTEPDHQQHHEQHSQQQQQQQQYEAQPQHIQDVDPLQQEPIQQVQQHQPHHQPPLQQPVALQHHQPPQTQPTLQEPPTSLSHTTSSPSSSSSPAPAGVQHQVSHPKIEAPKVEQQQQASDPQVTYQYSLTVSNPATGDIQIQSEAFPANPDQALVEPPIKKRKIVKNKGSKNSSTQENRVYNCTTCLKTFSRECHLLIHLRTHTGEKPYQCGICFQAFTHKNSLTIHMRGHTGERPYSCTTCGTSFTQKSNLRVHMRTHTGEKPFKCSLCTASFTQGSHLVAHVRIHNNERPFECEYCQQSFTQRSALKRHTMTHTGHKPHKCEECNSKFSQKDDLRRHQKVHDHGSSKDASKKQKSQDEGTDKVKPEKADGEVKAEFACTEKDCTSTFSGRYSLTRHMRNVHESKDNLKRKKKKPVVSESPKKIQKVKPKENDVSLVEPVRTSRRIREAAEKKKNRPEDSDFIIGDFVDMVEEEEAKPQMKMKVARKEKSPEGAKAETKEEMESWCFCEVPHGPNEPHTHVNVEAKVPAEQSGDLSGGSNLQQMASRIADTSGATSLLQLSMEDVQHNPAPTVLTGVTGSFQPQTVATAMTLDASSLVTNPQVVNNAVSIAGPPEQQSQVIAPIDQSGSATSINDANGQLIPAVSQSSLPNQVAGRIVGQPVLTTTPVLSTGQLVNTKIVTPDGTIYIEAEEVLSNGAVVINPGQGTYISYEQISVSSDGQVISFPVAGSGTETLMLQPAPSASGEAPAQNGTVTYTTAAPFTEANASQSVQYTAIGGDVLSILSQVDQGKEAAPTEKYTIVAKPFDCSVCAKSFAVKASLWSHMQESHPDLYSCSECCAAFTTLEFLENHKTEHQKLHFCSRCNQGFTSKSILSRHRLQVHAKNPSTEEKERIFACNLCKTKFYQCSDLKRHMLSHTGEKPFKCKSCEAGFTRMSSLNKHMRIHTGEKPYQCSLCEQSFAYRYQYNRHKIIHKDEYNSMPFVIVE